MAGRIGVALLTGGRAGISRLAGLGELRDRVAVRWVLDHDPATASDLAKRHGIDSAHFGKPHDIASVYQDSSVDAVLVCSPQADVNIVRRALRSGKSVLCDRPVSLQPAAILACYEESEVTNQSLVFGFSRRFDPAIHELKTRLDSGIIGEVHTLKTSSTYSPPADDTKRPSGNMFRDCVTQDVDTACWLLDGIPVSVYAGACAHLPEAVNSYDVDAVSMVLKFPTSMATVEVELNEFSHEHRLEVHGGKGVLVVENEQSDFTTVKTILGDGHWTKVAGTRVPNRDQQAFTSLLRHFINVLEGKERPTTGPLETIKAVCITSACEYSQRTNTAVTRETTDTDSPEVMLERPLWKERPAAWF